MKLVFSRSEEFIALDHRREGMVIELETGVRRDGTLVARRGRLVLDNGAYCGDGAFFAQMAAMHAVGPYRIPNVSIDAEPGLHQQAAVGLGPRADGAAGLLGASSSTWTRSPRRSGSTRSSCAAGTSLKEGDDGRRPARCSSGSAMPRRSSARSS